MEQTTVKLWLLIGNKEVEVEVNDYDGKDKYKGNKVVGVQICLDK